MSNGQCQPCCPVCSSPRRRRRGGERSGFLRELQRRERARLAAGELPSAGLGGSGRTRYKTFVLSGGSTRITLAAENHGRALLMFTASNTVSLDLFMEADEGDAPTVVGRAGFFEFATRPIIFTRKEHGALCTSRWFILDNVATSVISVYELLG